ncbi:MAG: hypothetical protein WDN04_18970 [Rhodospirillales bacterium]
MIRILDAILFGHRRKVLVVFALITLALGSFAVKVRAGRRLRQIAADRQ